MKSDRCFIAIPLCALCVFLLSGCGRGSVEEKEGNAAQSSLEVSQWLQGFKEDITSLLGTETSFYEIRRSDFKAPSIDLVYEEKREISAYAWNAGYILTSARGQGEEWYFLSCQKSDLEINKPKEIFTDWKHRPNGYAVCMDIVKEGMTAILFAECASDWQGDVLGYWYLNLGENGEVLSVQDVTDVYRELEAEGYAPYPESWWCDGDGYQYLVADGTRLAIIDPQGQLVLEKECDAASEESFAGVFHMPDGNLVFSRSLMAESRTELFWTELPGGQEHILWEGQGIGMGQFTVTPEGVMYYTGGSELMSWNLKTGEKARLFSFRGTGIWPGTFGFGDICYLTVGGEHELFLYSQEQRKVMVLTDNAAVNKDDITGISLLGGDYVRTCAAAFSREHEGTTIRVEMRQENSLSGREEQFTRLFAEIAAGNAPDIMLLQYGQMKTLQKMGLLEPLDSYLDQEIMDAMYTGMRESCRIDGVMYGVAFDVMSTMSVTSDKVWEGEKWTLQDILELIAGGKLEGLVPNSGPDFNLGYLGGRYLGKSPFFDEEKGESYFECDDFIRLLEVCKRYGKENNISKQEALELLAEGKILAITDHYYAIRDYVSSVENYDGRFHYVGYPGQTEGIGIYDDYTTYVVVSKDAKDKEVIGEFLNYLLGEETQKEVHFTPVNRNVIENKVEAVEVDGETIWFCGSTRVPNTECVSDYIALLDGAELPKEPGYHIWNIVEEETGAYWDGMKSAEEVAKIIDNRVQLYLDERN